MLRWEGPKHYLLLQQYTSQTDARQNPSRPTDIHKTLASTVQHPRLNKQTVSHCGSTLRLMLIAGDAAAAAAAAAARYGILTSPLVTWHHA
jgi:hypothetical protein